MRILTMAVMVLTVGVAAPSLAAKKHTHTPAAASTTAAGESLPTFDDCFRLAWVRGVHVERYELDDFNAQCLTNQVPFDSGMAVDSVQREHEPHSPHS